MAPKISIVIPVYNAEKYLSGCLDSILAQQYGGELELICVNDGSNDNSAQILQNYAAKNLNIKVISQVNKGAAAARNAGIKAASGKYISFIDADDYILAGLYSKFAQEINKEDVDIYMFNGQIETTEKKRTSVFFTSSMFKSNITEDDCIDYKDIANFFYGNQAIWNKIYRADFLREHNFCMKEGCVFEDTLFNFATIINAAKIRFTYQSFYIYRQNTQSVTSSIGANSLDLLKIFTDMEKESQKRGLAQYFSYALFQLEYEKIIETLSLTKSEFRQELFEKAQEFLKERIGKLNPQIFLKLGNINFGLALLNYTYEQFCNTLLLSKDTFHFSKIKPKNPMFSIIVPVYNVQRFLPLCIKSLTNQSYDNFEIICVNDGSTDGSQALLEQYAQADARITLINQENKGLGGARNTGVRAARGKYLLFVDSDDWISLDTLQKLNESVKQNEADIYMFGLLEFIDQTMQILPSVYMDRFAGINTCNIKDITDRMYIAPCAWNKLYRREYFIENDLFFEEKVYFEDVLIHTKSLICANKIAFSYHNLYYYRIRANSIINSGYSDKKINDLVQAFVSTINWLKQKGIYAEYKQRLANFAQINFSMQLNHFGKQYTEVVQNRIKNSPELSELFNLS